MTLCDGAGFDYDCQIETVEEGQVICTVLEKRPCPAEPDLDLTVYMALPKQDKMQLVVQKCVELGCREIVPVISEWCVSRPDPKSLQNKTERWQKIAWEAAKQCGRGVLPTVSPCPLRKRWRNWRKRISPSSSTRRAAAPSVSCWPRPRRPGRCAAAGCWWAARGG